MAKPLRILLVEDSERDAALILLYLRRGGYEPTMQRVETRFEMKAKLESGEWDVIISDFNLPGFNAYASLQVLQESGRRIPFIVLSGEISQEIIDGVTKAGANEYLAKYEMRQIVPAIERALQGRARGG
ncbi:MAG TPA: response regulator [Thermoanaerobaculia bacterium]|jgi:CheY-like chemotaxis protein|nr:response regulator [Thermoanaerobaculia bacterium]